MFIKKIKQENIIISATISFFCVYGLSKEYVTGANSLVESSTVFAFLLWILFSCIFYILNLNLSARELLASFPIALIIACCQRIGAEFSATNSFDIYNKNFMITVLALAITFSALLILLFRYFGSILDKLYESRINILSKKIFESKYSYYFIFGGILICWIPAFLAVYPGIYSYDAGPQVWQIFGGAGLSAHHPLVHTLLLDGCFYIGHSISGDYNIGLLLYTIIQSIFMAACFAYAINKMKIYKIEPIIQLISFAFFAFNPINQIWVMTTTKDVIYAGFFLVLLVDSLDLVIRKKEFFSKKIHFIKYCIEAACMCLFRNQGIYVLVLLLPFMLITMKGYRKKMLAMIMIPIILVKIFTGPISDSLGVQPANPREALSVPIQQLARVIALSPDTITDEEKNIVYEYIPKSYVDTYNPITSDTVKEGFNKELFEKDPNTFFKVWLSVGLKNKKIYVDSFLFGSYGYFYMDESPYWVQFILFDGAWMEPEQNILNIQRESKFPIYEKYLRAVSYELIQDKVPVVSTILNEAFPFWMLMVVLSVLVYRRKYSEIVPFFLVAGFWGTTLLGPLIAIRYAYPIIVCIPTMLAVMCLNCEETNDSAYLKRKELEL